LQVDSFHEYRIGRHLVARLYKDDITHDYIAAWHLHDFAVTPHLHGLILVDGCQHTELARCVALEVKAHRSGNEDGNENT